MSNQPRITNKEINSHITLFVEGGKLEFFCAWEQDKATENIQAAMKNGTLLNIKSLISDSTVQRPATTGVRGEKIIFFSVAHISHIDLGMGLIN